MSRLVLDGGPERGRFNDVVPGVVEHFSDSVGLDEYMTVCG